MKIYKKEEYGLQCRSENRGLRKILTVLIAFVFFIPKSEAQGIEFMHDLDKALEKAKLENKLVFVDFYTSWCGPCKALDKNVFPLEKAGSFFNSRFISCKVQCDDKGVGVELGKKYNVNAYPTLMFLNGKGEMVHSEAGSPSVDSLIEIAEIALNPEKNLMSLVKKWDSGNRDKEFVLKYFAKLNEAYRNDKARTDFIEYFNSLSENGKISKSTFELVKVVGTAPFSAVFDFIETNKSKYYKAVGQLEIDNFIATTYLWHLKNIAMHGSNEEYKIAMGKFKLKHYPYYEEYETFYSVFLASNDTKEYMKLGTDFLSKYGKNNDSYTTALSSLLGNLTGRANEGEAGILWMENLLKRNPDPKYMSTYFYILWRNYRFEKSLEVAEQIRATAIKQNQSTEAIDEQIKQIIAFRDKVAKKNKT